MHTHNGIRLITIALSVSILIFSLFSTDYLINPASARSYCDKIWLTQPDPDQVVWLPYRTYCDRFQTMSSNPSFFLVDDYPAEDLPNCKELGSAWYIETESNHLGCEIVPVSGYSTDIPFQLPIACNGNTNPPVRHYYVSAKTEVYGRNFDIFCPGYPKQSWFASVASKHFVREPVGPEEPIKGKNLGTPSCGLSAGNPVNIATGNKFHAEHDISFPGGLTLSRFYNSDDTALHSFGKSWRGSYSRRIDVIYSGEQSDASLTLVSDDGTENYWRIVDGVPKAPPDATATLDVVYDNGHVLGFLLVSSESTIETYDSNGKLLSLVNENGEALDFTYAGSTLIAVTTSTGRTLTYSHLSDGRVAEVSSNAGSTWNYIYNGNDNLVRVEFSDGSSKTYHYESNLFPHALTGVTDENGNRIRSWEYDDSGRAILSTYGGPESSIERHTIIYNPDGTSTTSGPLQHSVDLSYKARHGVYKFEAASDACTGCGNSAKSTTYDEWGNRDKVTDFAGNTTDYDYTADNLIQKVTYALGTPQQYQVEYSWDVHLRKPAQVTTENKVTSYTYNPRGQVLTKTETDTSGGAKRTWTYSYFETPAQPPLVGKLKNINGPRTDVSDISQYEYYTTDHESGNYRAGDLSAVTNPQGHRTEYLKYDGNGQLLEVSGVNGVVTSIEYHPRGWKSSTTTSGKTTRFIHDRAGNLTGYVQPDGNVISYSYDNYHRLTAIGDGLGNRIEYTLDAAGNRTSEHTVDKLGNLHRQLGRVYNSLNQLEATIDGNNGETRYEYDGNGNLTGISDANMNTTRYEFDSLKRLVKVIDPILGQTLMTHDSGNNATSVVDPMGNVTRYAFDGLANQIETDSPDTGNTVYEYDEAGNRTAAIDARGVRTEFSYDAINRLLKISFPDSSLDVIYSYDEGLHGQGHLTGMIDAVGTVVYAYDLNGNLLRETRTVHGTQFITSFAYDSVDRLVQITYPSGMIIDYQLDATGQVSSIGKSGDTGTELLVSNVEYAPFGPVNSFAYGNGTTYSSTLNLDYGPVQIQSGPALDWALQHDRLGNIVTVTDQADSQKSQVFSYDDIYRLNSAQGEYGSKSFAYDANGNRTHFESDTADEPYSYDPQSNQLVAQGNWTITRDASGNRIEKLDTNGFGHLYSFGDHSRLMQTSIYNGSTASVVGTYDYNGRGQRAHKTVNGENIRYIYGLAGELIGEYSSQAEGTSTEYVYLNGQPIAAITRALKLHNPSGEELILDNGAPGTSSTGTWKRVTNRGGYDGDHLYAGKASNRTYRWTATPPGPLYEVYAWWVDRKKQSGSVDYTIRYGAGETETVTMSHKTGGSQWQLLGTYHSTDGQDYVEVSSQSNKFVADAVRWVEVIDPTVIQLETTGFIHFDHLGTPRRVTNENQTVIWSWDSTPFGDSAPDQDPDGDLQSYVLNLRFPGQYYDAESGLHYNYFRTYDPSTGRYIESDPIGLRGGLNTFGYAFQRPQNFVDRFGLLVSGEWIAQPRFNLGGYGIDDFELVSGSGNLWGQLSFVRLYGYVAGFVNIDVKCNNSDACDNSNWEVHNQIEVFYQGSTDIGVNAYAFVAGKALGLYGWAAANILASGGSTLTGGLEILKGAQQKAGVEIALAYALGPDAICLVSGGY